MSGLADDIMPNMGANLPIRMPPPVPTWKGRNSPFSKAVLAERSDQVNFTSLVP